MVVTSAREVFDSGDPRAAAVIGLMVDHLARMLGAATTLLNPDVIVVGGGVAQAGEKLLGPLRERAGRYMLSSHRRALRTVPATHNYKRVPFFESSRYSWGWKHLACGRPAGAGKTGPTTQPSAASCYTGDLPAARARHQILPPRKLPGIGDESPLLGRR